MIFLKQEVLMKLINFLEFGPLKEIMEKMKIDRNEKIEIDRIKKIEIK